jgi:hypothetical protein
MRALRGLRAPRLAFARTARIFSSAPAPLPASLAADPPPSAPSAPGASPASQLTARLSACGSVPELAALVGAHAGEFNAFTEVHVASLCEALGGGGADPAARALLLGAVGRWLARPEEERTGRSAAGLLHAAAQPAAREAAPVVGQLLREVVRLAPTLSDASTAARGLAAAGRLPPSLYRALAAAPPPPPLPPRGATAAGAPAALRPPQEGGRGAGRARAALVRPLAAAALRLLPGAPPSAAHASLLALARLGVFDFALSDPFLVAAAAHAPRASDAEEVTLSLWAAAQLGYSAREGARERGAVVALAGATARLAGALDGATAARALWAAAKLGVADGAVTAPLAAAAAAGAASLDARHAYLALWAAGCLAGTPRRLPAAQVAPLVAAAARECGGFRAPSAAGALWALGALGALAAGGAVAPLLAAAAAAAPAFCAQSATDALWGAAQLGLPAGAATAPLLAAAARTAPANANANNAAAALWAAASMGATEEATLAPLRAAAERAAPLMNARSAHAALLATAVGAPLSERARAACRASLAAQPPPPPPPHRRAGAGRRHSLRASLAAALERAGLAAEASVPLCGGLLRADFLVARRVALMVKPPGEAAQPLHSRVLAAEGLTRVVVGWDEWAAWERAGEQAAQLKARVEGALAAAGAEGGGASKN